MFKSGAYILYGLIYPLFINSSAEIPRTITSHKFNGLPSNLENVAVNKILLQL